MHTFAKTFLNNFTKSYYHLHDGDQDFTTLLQTEKGIEIRSKYLTGIAEGKRAYNSDYYRFTFHPKNGNSITQEMKIHHETNPDKVKFTLSMGSNPLTMEYPFLPSDSDWDSAILYQAALLFLITRELKPANVIQEIEEVLMMNLPDKIRNEILDSQTEKNLNLLSEFKDIQTAVKTHVFSTLDTNALFKKLHGLKEKLLLEFDIPSKHVLAELLELVCCPTSSLKSIRINQGSFMPLHAALPLGPMKLVQTDSLILKKNSVSCLFPIPQKGKVSMDHFSEGFYYLFNQEKDVSFTTISQTSWGFSCRNNGLEYKVKKQEYSKLKTLKNSSKGQFTFNLWKQGELGETLFTKTFFIAWKEEKSQIILNVAKNSLKLIHPVFETDEEWIDAVIYQSALLYFQCIELKTVG